MDLKQKVYRKMFRLLTFKSFTVLIVHPDQVHKMSKKR